MSLGGEEGDAYIYKEPGTVLVMEMRNGTENLHEKPATGRGECSWQREVKKKKKKKKDQWKQDREGRERQTDRQKERKKETEANLS